MGRSQFVEIVVAPLGPEGELKPVPGIGATPFVVNEAGVQGAQPTVYAARTGSTPAASLTTDSNGTVSFWCNPGDYNVAFDDPTSPPRITPYTRGFMASASVFDINALSAFVLQPITVLGDFAASIGQFVIADNPCVITLPDPSGVPGMIAVMAGSSVVAANPVHITGPASSEFGEGALGVTSLNIGQIGKAIIFASDGLSPGGHWCLLAGEVDTGWLPITINGGGGSHGLSTPGKVGTTLGAGANTGIAMYRWKGTHVQLRGSIHADIGGSPPSQGDLSNTTLATGLPLPPAMAVPIGPPEGSGCGVYIDTTGNMKTTSNASATIQSDVYLDGLGYDVV